MKQLKPAFGYKPNPTKVNELLGEKSKLNGFEKHVLQEGLKELLFGTGPIETAMEKIIFRDLTPSMKHYLIHYGVIEEIDTTFKPEDIMEKLKGKNHSIILKEEEKKKYTVEETKAFNPIKVVVGKPGFQFLGGIQAMKFGFETLQRSLMNIYITSNKPIYYDEQLLFEAGDKIPFYSSARDWGYPEFLTYEIDAIVDLRRSVIQVLTGYGEEFNPKKLNCCGHCKKAGPTEFELTIHY